MPSPTAREDRTLPHESDRETELRHEFGRLMACVPLKPEELPDSLALFLRKQSLADLLSMDALYRMALNVPGVIMEFGVHRGRHMALLTALRGVHEPYNPHRRIIGFDTFEGFPDVAGIDRLGGSAVPGKFGLPHSYVSYLREVLALHEANEPLGHINRTILVEGDVRETLPAYLESNPQTIVSPAYFDLDLYEPTVEALRAIRPYLTRGSVLAFDELAHAKWPGETAAVREALDLDDVSLQLIPGRAQPAFLRWGAHA